MLILRRNYQKKIQETDEESKKKNAKHRGTQQLMSLTKTTLFKGKTHKFLFLKLITPRSHITLEIISFQLKQELQNLDEKRKRKHAHIRGCSSAPFILRFLEIFQKRF